MVYWKIKMQGGGLEKFADIKKSVAVVGRRAHLERKVSYDTPLADLMHPFE
jgi:hypothetical protein